MPAKKNCSPIVLLGMFAACVAASSAVPAQAEGLVIRVYPLAAAGTEYVAAQEVAEKILSAAGVETVWTNCGGAERPARCDARRAPGEVILRLLPASQRQDGAIGYATPRAGRIGGHASVFVTGAEDVARHAGVAPAIVLGHAIAHEIGHLVLGYGQHARRGLMRADWSRADLTRMSRGGLGFSADERELIRQRERERAEPPPADQAASALAG